MLMLKAFSYMVSHSADGPSLMEYCESVALVGRENQRDL